jgi:hypothetical protein
MDPNKRLVLTDKRNVGAWAVPALSELVHRVTPSPVGTDNAASIEFTRTLKIGVMGEHRRIAAVGLKSTAFAECGRIYRAQAEGFSGTCYGMQVHALRVRRVESESYLLPLFMSSTRAVLLEFQSRRGT